MLVNTKYTHCVLCVAGSIGNILRAFATFPKALTHLWSIISLTLLPRERRACATLETMLSLSLFE